MALVLGIDSSTQSTKGEARDIDTGAVVARGNAAHPPTSPPVSEQDPVAWWAALTEAITQLGDHRVADGTQTADHSDDQDRDQEDPLEGQHAFVLPPHTSQKTLHVVAPCARRELRKPAWPTLRRTGRYTHL